MGRTLAAHFCSTFSTSLSRLRQIRRERPKVLRPSGGMLLGCSKTLGPRSPRPYGPEWMSCRLLLSEQLSERLRSVLQESLTLPKALRQPQNQPVGFMVIICYHSPKKKNMAVRRREKQKRRNAKQHSTFFRSLAYQHTHTRTRIYPCPWFCVGADSLFKTRRAVKFWSSGSHTTTSIRDRDETPSLSLAFFATHSREKN